MNNQEQFQQFGVIVFLIILTYAMSSCERGINHESIIRIESKIDKVIKNK